MHFPTQGKKFSISCAFFPIDFFKGEKKKVWQIVIVGIEMDQSDLDTTTKLQDQWEANYDLVHSTEYLDCQMNPKKKKEKLKPPKLQWRRF